MKIVYPDHPDEQWSNRTRFTYRN